MQYTASLPADRFDDPLRRLPTDLDALARQTKAVERKHEIGSGTQVMRLALARGPGGLSLSQTAAWASMLGMAEISDPAVKYRLDKPAPAKLVPAKLVPAKAGGGGQSPGLASVTPPRAAPPMFAELRRSYKATASFLTRRAENLMTGNSAYLSGLDRNQANYAPLTPLTFLERAAYVYPDKLSVVHGTERYTWRETYARCRRLASALARRGIGKNDTVAVMAPNTPPMYEASFGVPMCGAVMNPLNTRLDAETVAFMLRHGGARALITDREFSPVVGKALALLDTKPLIIDIDDPACQDGVLLGETTYEQFLAEGDPDYDWQPPQDEWDAISLSYTSGTTGDPKGVVYHHRGAHLNAVSNILNWGMPHHPVYLWTLPMFHCNGWCFPWTVAERAGVNVCLRRIEAKAAWDAIRTHGVTHMCGAPIVYSMLINAPAELRAGVRQRIAGQVAGAAPPAAIIEGAEKIGIELTHVYGLTEVYGPAAVCAKHAAWSTMPIDRRAERNGRQGVRTPLQEAMAVLDPDTMQPVPWDGETMGEIMFRGNITMKGYLSNPGATERAFAGGWFHTGDLAVMQPDGYVKIRDRSKDIIISGGENISSIEVEEVLYHHPSVLSAAVVAQPDEKWGETPCAFVELKPDATVTAEELRAFCRERLAHFKVPKTFVFREIPKTSTGKIQKFVLREVAKSASAIT